MSLGLGSGAPSFSNEEDSAYSLEDITTGGRVQEKCVATILLTARGDDGENALTNK